jgi:hypothetical protein
LVNGQTVVVSASSTLTGLTAGGTYYVVSAATNSFGLSATFGGSAITVGSGSTTVSFGCVQYAVSGSPAAASAFGSIATTGLGYEYVWLDGIKVVNLSGINFGYAASTSAQYWKAGIYAAIAPPSATFKVHYYGMEVCQAPCTLASRVTNPLPLIQ